MFDPMIRDRTWDPMLGAILFALLFATSGCSEETPTPPRGITKAPTAQSTTVDAPLAAASAVPEHVRRAEWDDSPDHAALSEGRDPFEIPLIPVCIPPVGDPIRLEGTVVDTQAEALHLIATITGGVQNKAMVTDEHGVGHVVRRGDLVGLDPPMRVVRITRNEVGFRGLGEDAPEQILKTLWSEAELQRL